MKHKTKDELFLLKLYELALKSQDTYTAVDRFQVGEALGLQQRAIDTIARDLAKANFIKKDEEGSIYLTQNGVDLVLHLLEE